MNGFQRLTRDHLGAFVSLLLSVTWLAGGFPRAAAQAPANAPTGQAISLPALITDACVCGRGRYLALQTEKRIVILDLKLRTIVDHLPAQPSDLMAGGADHFVLTDPQAVNVRRFEVGSWRPTGQFKLDLVAGAAKDQTLPIYATAIPVGSRGPLLTLSKTQWRAYDLHTMDPLLSQPEDVRQPDRRPKYDVRSFPFSQAFYLRPAPETRADQREHIVLNGDTDGVRQYDLYGDHFLLNGRHIPNPSSGVSQNRFEMNAADSMWKMQFQHWMSRRVLEVTQVVDLVPPGALQPTGKIEGVPVELLRRDSKSKMKLRPEKCIYLFVRYGVLVLLHEPHVHLIPFDPTSAIGDALYFDSWSRLEAQAGSKYASPIRLVTKQPATLILELAPRGMTIQNNMLVWNVPEGAKSGRCTVVIKATSGDRFSFQRHTIQINGKPYGKPIEMAKDSQSFAWEFAKESPAIPSGLATVDPPNGTDSNNTSYEARTWRNVEGRAIVKAQFVRLINDQEVELKSASGKMLRRPIGELSIDDIYYLGEVLQR